MPSHTKSQAPASRAASPVTESDSSTPASGSNASTSSGQTSTSGDQHSPSHSETDEDDSSSESLRLSKRPRICRPSAAAAPQLPTQPEADVSDLASRSASQEETVQEGNAPTIVLLGRRLVPGDRDYELARRVSGQQRPYWFAGDNMNSVGDEAYGSALGRESGNEEREDNVVEIHLDDD